MVLTWTQWSPASRWFQIVDGLESWRTLRIQGGRFQWSGDKVNCGHRRLHWGPTTSSHWLEGCNQQHYCDTNLDQNWISHWDPFWMGVFGDVGVTLTDCLQPPWLLPLIYTTILWSRTWIWTHLQMWVEKLCTMQPESGLELSCKPR